MYTTPDKGHGRGNQELNRERTGVTTKVAGHVEVYRTHTDTPFSTRLLQWSD